MNVHSELVSVLIPSYNRFNYLLRAIECVNNQTHKNFEIIVVNDGSDEEGYYKHNFPENVKIININREETPNWGGARDPVRNYGLSSVTGKYIAFLDDDDYWLPTKVEDQLSHLKKYNVGFSCTEGYFGYGDYDDTKKYILYNSERHLKKIKKKYLFTKYFKFNKFPIIWKYDFLKHHNSVVNSSVIVKTEVFKKLGGFRGIFREERARHTADHDCWLGLLQLTDLVYVDKPLFYYDAGHGQGQLYSDNN
jgi:glycosyltransferase involved in cell wall biosynthesis